ncbi:hypothetical protein CRI77_15070 [Mycolicibacterium duvalii]|uniref:Uncharacterized protein n=1 Tax=Mycolicibacterium duvalii TaxID=39688 RepID=A0A7I7K385_9MYCO|nr:hypothetical protein [Mycolicibacterium duvalii]MCV7370565.1 hypothetical protein [Mycolicibacterium duvalii]PEG39858.1 hypothetical protein CRI77_15070 [Mycolicibacterium duvalii]BBX18054.1 hypothetical protein MDUV_29140 [Mycolicibacterium duvalii]
MEPRERIPRDDWADQDLLTRGEAAERLEAEIAEVTKMIAAGKGDELLERRLAGMREALQHYRER